MGRRPDLVGQRFGKLTVIRLTDKRDNRNIKMWECKCDCGNTIYLPTNRLTSGNTKSCGCLQKEKAAKVNFKDLTGQRFGMLTVIELDKTKKTQGVNRWKCKCDCGKYSYPTSHALLSGNTKSCGCQRKKPIKDITGQRFGMWTVLKMDGKHEDGFIYWLCKCDCGTIKSVRGNNLKTGISTSCGCLKSKGEFFVFNWLKEHNFNFEKEYSYPDLLGDKAPLRFDFYVNNKLIEVMGIQHYNHREWGNPEKLREYDKLKKDYCDKNNIPILYLDYNIDSTIPIEKWNIQLTNFLEADK